MNTGTIIRRHIEPLNKCQIINLQLAAWQISQSRHYSDRRYSDHRSTYIGEIKYKVAVGLQATGKFHLELISYYRLVLVHYNLLQR
jgi:hypothetical protein